MLSGGGGGGEGCHGCDRGTDAIGGGGELRATVGLEVGLQVGELREGLVAGGHVALVGPLARVPPPVLPQVRELREPLLAVVAAVRPLARVDAAVLAQVHLLAERLEALGALVGPRAAVRPCPAAVGVGALVRRARRLIQQRAFCCNA